MRGLLFGIVLLVSGINDGKPQAPMLPDATTAVPAVAPVPVSKTAIPLVDCPAARSAGTAFRVGRHLLVTAGHVADDGPCLIEGRPMKVLFRDKVRDFAEVDDGADGPTIAIDCGGYIKGRTYTAIGHARGLAILTRVSDLIATGDTADLPDHGGPISVLAGMLTSIPGQSGGPTVDTETGAAVGIVNASDFRAGVSGSVPLSDTRVCAKPKKA